MLICYVTLLINYPRLILTYTYTSKHLEYYYSGYMCVHRETYLLIINMFTCNRNQATYCILKSNYKHDCCKHKINWFYVAPQSQKKRCSLIAREHWLQNYENNVFHLHAMLVRMLETNNDCTMKKSVFLILLHVHHASTNVQLMS